jgi:catechol 2,3-dioxygenase-like lactoylglutathione lyase family enzyme
MSARHVLTILAVTDLDRAVAFYATAFALRERVRAPTYVELALDEERGLGLYRRDGFARNTGTAPMAANAHDGEITGSELYFRCDDGVELGAIIERVQRIGARVLSPRAPRDWGDEAAYFADPDGNVVVVAAPLRAGG